MSRKSQELSQPKFAFRREAAVRRPGQRVAPKQAVNVSVDAGILKAARAMKLNLSQVLERELDKLTAEERARRFYEENKATFDAYNAYVEKHGTLTEQFEREFGDDDPAV